MLVQWVQCFPCTWLAWIWFPRYNIPRVIYQEWALITTSFGPPKKKEKGKIFLIKIFVFLPFYWGIGKLYFLCIYQFNSKSHERRIILMVIALCSEHYVIVQNIQTSVDTLVGVGDIPSKVVFFLKIISFVLIIKCCTKLIIAFSMVIWD